MHLDFALVGVGVVGNQLVTVLITQHPQGSYTLDNLRPGLFEPALPIEFEVLAPDQRQLSALTAHKRQSRRVCRKNSKWFVSYLF